jgi:predicted Rossmann fold nucleotide-binding protein DprA/Smf involved in DNA uptake
VDASAAVLEETCHLVRALAAAGALFVGGFHSPLERSCLGQIVAEKAPAAVFLSRTLIDLKIPIAWLQLLRETKLVLVSACSPSERRATRESVRMRNECVAAMADSFFVPHASVGGKAEALCREVLKTGKEVWTFNHAGSRNLLTLGAKMATTSRVSEILESARKDRAAFSQSGD